MDDARTFLTAAEAASELGIRVDTLYAYVSRGLLQSEPAQDGSRSRRYLAEDVRRLQRRQSARRDPGAAAEPPLTWGFPVIESAITSLSDQTIAYRGHDVTTLATTCTIEHAAGLLWNNDLETPVTLPDLSESERMIQDDILVFFPLIEIEPHPAFQALMARLLAGDATAYDFRPATIGAKASCILRHLVTLVSGIERAAMAACLRQRWAPDNAEAERLLNAALILCADHELNASSFTVRCIASTRAPLHAVVSGGISALLGTKHGGASLAVEALFDEVARSEDAASILAQRLRRGEQIPGFGHRLYPDGDPRANVLLTLCGQLNKPDDLASSIASAGFEMTGMHPNLEFGLVALARTLDAPAGSALTLMTLGRSVGWVAHAMEEYQRNELIRPRARYTGPLPH